MNNMNIFISVFRRKPEFMFEEFRFSHDVAASVDIPNSPSDFDVNLIDDFDINEWRFGEGGGQCGGRQVRVNIGYYLALALIFMLSLACQPK